MIVIVILIDFPIFFGDAIFVEMSPMNVLEKLFLQTVLFDRVRFAEFIDHPHQNRHIKGEDPDISISEKATGKYE